MSNFLKAVNSQTTSNRLFSQNLNRLINRLYMINNFFILVQISVNLNQLNFLLSTNSASLVKLMKLLKF